MSKVWWIVGILALVVGAVWGFLGWRWWKSNASPSSTLTVQPTLTPKSQEARPTPAPEKTYRDDAGLSFRYPGNIVITDDTPDDGRHYTLLTLKLGSEQMKLIVRDTELTSTDEWSTKDKDAPKQPTFVGAASIGNIGGRQFVASGKLYTVAVNDGVLYEVVGINDGGFWGTVHKRIIETMAFEKPQSTAPQTAPGSEETTVYEEEEVIE